MLRGRILRDGGRYDAAEVAFQGAMQATDHDVPRHEAEREIHGTRRAAALGGKRPREFSPREQWFAVKGGILLTERAEGASVAERVAQAVGALAALAAAAEWRPAAVGARHAGRPGARRRRRRPRSRSPRSAAPRSTRRTGR